MTIEELVVIIKAETAQLEKGIDKIKSQLTSLDTVADKVSGRLTKAFTKSSTGLGKAFKALSLGAITAGLVSFGKNAINAASDLQEWRNVVDVAFGKASGAVDAFAAQAVNQFGLSKVATLQLAGTFKAMADGLDMGQKAGAKMAIQLSGLSADMASFFNSDIITTSNALQGIFTNQTRALKQFGIVLSDANLEAFRLERGITTAYSKMNEAQRVALRYNYVLAQTANSQNDFARTSMSWANQMRQLSMNWNSLITTIGNGLIKLLTPVVAILNKILSAAIAVVNAIAKIFGGQGISSMGTSLKEAGTGIDGLNDGIGNVGDGLGNANKAAKKFKATIAGFDELEILNSQPSGGSGGGSGSGGGGGGGVSADDIDSYFDLYDEEGILNKWEDFMAKIKAMMDADNWEGVGAEIGKGLNYVFKVIDDFITNKFEPFGVLWAGRIARVLNGLVETVDWNLIGKTFADGLNSYIHIANTFYENFNALNFAIGIGTAINSWFTNVDWEGIGSYLANKLNFLGDILYGFSITIDWERIKNSIQTALTTAFENIDVEKIKVSIQKLVNDAMDFLMSVDWYRIGYTVGEMLSGVDWLGVLKNVKDEVIMPAWSGFWDGLMSDGQNYIIGTLGKIGTWFKESFWGPFAAAAFGAAGTNIMLGATRGFFKDGRDSFIREIARSGTYFITSFGGLVPKWGKRATNIFDETFGATGSTTMATQLSLKMGGFQLGKAFETTFSGIGDNVKHPINSIKRIWNDLGASFITLKEKLEGISLGSVFTNVKTALSGLVKFLSSDAAIGFAAVTAAVLSLFSAYGGLGGVLQRVGQIWSDTVEHVKNFANSIGFSDKLDALKDAFGRLYDLLGKLKPIWEVFFTTITGIATTALNMIVGAVNDFVGIITGIINVFVGALTLDFDTLWEGIKQIFSGGVNFVIDIVKGFVNGVIQWFKDLKYNLIGDPIVIDMWEGIKKVFKDAINKVVDFVKGLVNKVVEFFTNLWNKAKEIFTNIKNFLETTWSAIKTVAVNTWTAIKDKLSEIGSAIKTAITNTWDAIKTAVSNAVNSLKENVSNKWGEIKTATSNSWNNIKSTLSNVWDGIKSNAKSITDNIANAFTSAYDRIKSAWSGFKGFFSGVWSGIGETCKSAMNGMIKKLNKFKVNVPDWVPLIGGSKWGLNIPYLANGGVINSPTVAMMGEYAGAHSNPEIVAPQSLLREVISQENGEMVSALYQIARQIISAIDDVDLSVSIGDDAIGNAANRANNAYKKRTGKPLFSM